jgi:hypothetical protein
MVTVTANTIGQISDGYHTFDELYEHRYELWVALCRVIALYTDSDAEVWRCKLNSDGTSYDGYFLLGLDDYQNGKSNQITYHLPLRFWEQCNFSHTYDKPHRYDGHTSADVLDRLRSL